jgi:hypothetical protein
MKNPLLYLGVTPEGRLTNNTTVSLDQFGDLYHGTDQPNLTHIDYRSSSKPIWDMSKNFNYATSHLGTAISWAAHANYPRRNGLPKSLYVYRVTPTEGHWMVDKNIHGPRATPEHLLNLQNEPQNDDEFMAPSFRFSHPLRAQLVYAREGKMDLRGPEGWNQRLFEGLGDNPSFS